VIIDKFDGVRYMFNEEKNFKELYPERDDVYEFDIAGKTLEEKKKVLKEKIKDLKIKLKEFSKNTSKEFNEKDLELKVKIYENRLLELERGLTQHYGSPLYIGEKGLKTFFFFRTSGELIPIRWDLRGSSIYKDIAYKKKQSAVAYQNLMNKYSSKIRKIVETSTVWLLFLLIIWTIVLLAGVSYYITNIQVLIKCMIRVRLLN